MEQLSLAVETRTGTGKGVTRKLRRAGKLPGVLYGLGNNQPITVEPKPIHNLLTTEGGRNQIINLTGGITGKHALVKDYQVDPVTRKLLHVDLIEIDVTKKIEVTVPLNYTGKSIGVAEGGVLNLIQRTLQIRCVPTAIPQHIDIDVSALNIGDSIHLDQVTLPEGVDKATQSNPTLVTVVPPTKEEAVASLAPTAEPEVITEKKPAEGEAAAPAAEAKKEEKKK